MVTRSRFRPVAIALVVQDDDGSLMIMGSKKLDSFTVEIQHDIRGGVLGEPFVSHWRGTDKPTAYVQAECQDFVMHYSRATTLPPQIEQRGIYLPDMSFRALPAPKES